MPRFRLATLAAAALLQATPLALAGELGDGGYGGHVYGQQQPYYSGEDNDGGQDYGRRGEAGDDGEDDEDRYDNNGAQGHAQYGRGGAPYDQRGAPYDDGSEYEERRTQRHSYQGSTKDGYVPRHEADVDRPHRGACVPGWRVKQRLIAEGWSNFHLNTYGRGVAVVRATRVHTGRPFVLRIDACTGQTLSSIPADRRRYSSRD